MWRPFGPPRPTVALPHVDVVELEPCEIPRRALGEFGALISREFVDAGRIDEHHVAVTGGMPVRSRFAPRLAVERAGAERCPAEQRVQQR